MSSSGIASACAPSKVTRPPHHYQLRTLDTFEDKTCAFVHLVPSLDDCPSPVVGHSLPPLRHTPTALRVSLLISVLYGEVTSGLGVTLYYVWPPTVQWPHVTSIVSLRLLFNSCYAQLLTLSFCSIVLEQSATTGVVLASFSCERRRSGVRL